MYSGYYCKKCKNIPLVKANITENKDIKFIVKCKCGINYITFDQINKKYYTKNINNLSIANEKIMEDIKNDDSSLSEMKKTIDIIRNNNNFLDIIKEKSVNYLKSKIREIELLFDKVKNINDIFEKTSLTLIKAYECIKSNYSNIKNIQLNAYNNIVKINKTDINFIIRENDLHSTLNNIESFINAIIPVHKHNTNLKRISKITENTSKILKISNELLFLGKKDFLYIYSINNFTPIAKIDIKSLAFNLQRQLKISDELYLIKLKIDKQGNIISLFCNFIAIFPKINECQIESIKNDNSINTINDVPILNIEPLIVFNINSDCFDILYWDDDTDKINESKLISYDEKSINFFKYDLIKKTYSMFHTFNCLSYKNQIIKYNDRKALVILTPTKLLLYDLSIYKIIEELKIDLEEYETNIIQINNQELLITKDKMIYIISLKNFQIKLKINYISYINHIFMLNDSSIVICSVKYIKRYSQKNFEMIDEFSEESKDIYDVYNYFENIFIEKSLQISNGKILIILNNGNCELHELLI